MQGSVRNNIALTNLSIQYKNAEYIAGQFVKDIPVIKDNDKYFIYNDDYRLPDTYRANKALANMYTFGVSTSTYSVNQHALKDIITNTDRENTDSPLDLDRDTVELLTDKLMLRYEYDCHSLLFTTTTFSNNATLTSNTSWLYHTVTSAPIQNVLSASSYIIQQSGKTPNVGVTNIDVYMALRENPNVYGRIQYVERAILTKEILAALFDIDQLYVGSAIIDAALEGNTASKSLIWGGHFLLGYFDPSPGLRKVTAAANFRVTEFGTPMSVKKWFDEDVDGDYIEVRTKYKAQAIATLCGYLIKSCAL